MEKTAVRFPLRVAAVGLTVLALFLWSIPFDCSAAEAPKKSPSSGKTSPARSKDMAGKTHDLVNEYRKSQGLKPLKMNPFLNEVAAEHSRQMASGKVAFGHGGFEQRAKTVQSKWKYRSVAENVGMSMGHPDPADEVVQGWLKSPSHLKNIKGDFELTGIGVARKGESYYFTQIFLKKLD